LNTTQNIAIQYIEEIAIEMNLLQSTSLSTAANDRDIGGEDETLSPFQLSFMDSFLKQPSTSSSTADSINSSKSAIIIEIGFYMQLPPISPAISPFEWWKKGKCYEFRARIYSGSIYNETLFRARIYSGLCVSIPAFICNFDFLDDNQNKNTLII
jgi:hypothetical protein